MEAQERKQGASEAAHKPAEFITEIAFSNDGGFGKNRHDKIVYFGVAYSCMHKSNLYNALEYILRAKFIDDCKVKL